MLIRVLAAPAPGRGRDDARAAEPVTFGVPLPRGLIKEPEGWAIQSDDSAWSAVQARVLDRWADGTARWVLADAQIRTPAAGAGAINLDISRTGALPSARITASSGPDGVQVATGAA